MPAGAEADIKQGDALNLPFADGEFDRVIAAEVLEHIPADELAIAELVRVLRPGGTIAVTVPRWLLTDKAIVAAYLALVDRICPCVMLVHSQGGTFGFQVAEQRPDKIKGIVAVEAASPGNIANAAKLKDIPVLQIFGDYVDQHPRWSTFKKMDTAYGEAIKQAGGTADWINLPDIGIKGNSHMLMKDKNSDQIAEVIQKWLVNKGLSD